VLRILLAAVTGAAVAGAIAWIISFDEAWAWLVVPAGILALTGFPVILLLVSIARAGGPLRGQDHIDAAEAEADGRLALARVLDIKRTGVEINDQPVCDIDLLVTPHHGSPFQVRARRLVDIVEIPRVQPGAVVVVATERREPSPVSIVMQPPFEWQRLAETDQRVRETPSAPVYQPPAEEARRGAVRRIHPAVYGLALLVGAALALIPAYPVIAALLGGQTTVDEIRYAVSWEGRQAAQNRADEESEAAANMFEPGNAQHALDELVGVIGGTQVTDITLFGSTATATAPSSPGAMTLDDYLYVDGAAERIGPASSQAEPDALTGLLFDVSEVDLSLLPSITDRIAGLTGIEPVSEQTVSIGRSTVVSAGGSETMLVFTVPVDGEYYDAWLTFDMSGDVVGMRGGAPGSPSYAAEHDQVG